MAISRRLLFWLIRAYFKRWQKQILIFFLIGLGSFFVFRFFLSTIVAKIPLIQKDYIGMEGSYTVDTIPESILRDVSKSLIDVNNAGIPQPDLASSWEVKNKGKTYIIHLKPHEHFADGSDLISDNVKFSFSDVKIERPNQSTIIFQLKDPYAPFLLALTQPLFKDGFVGIGGSYEIKDIKLNDKFITSLTLTGIVNPLKVKVFQFYPTENAAKLAFVLGSDGEIANLTNTNFKNSTFAKYPNAVVTRQTNYKRLVTLFYNTQDPVLSDKRLRDALSYSLPDRFNEGERTSSPISPRSWAYQPDFQRPQDREHAKILLKAIEGSGVKLPELSITTLLVYKNVAKKIQASWKTSGISAKIIIANHRPDVFQIFLGEFNIPQDPDQYSLWHSDQPNNISNYHSVRIDKLLEDGRKTIDQNQRLKIYSDFQKYLLDDQPASFLFFPYTYMVTRK